MGQKSLGVALRRESGPGLAVPADDVSQRAAHDHLVELEPREPEPYRRLGEADPTGTKA